MPTKVKAANETRTSTAVAYVDDSDLSVSLEAGTYFIEIGVLFETGATPQMSMNTRYTGTLLDSLCMWFGCSCNDNRFAYSGYPRQCFIDETWFVSGGIGYFGSDTANTAGLYYLRGILRTVTPGNLKVQWCQSVTTASPTTVLAGSYIKYARSVHMPGTMTVKALDESRSSTTTYAADTDLQFPVEASTPYLGELIFLNVNTNTERFKHRMPDAGCSVAVGHSNRHQNTVNVQLSGSHSSLAGTWTANMFTTPLELPSFITTYCWAVWGMIQGGSAGNVQVEWAQQISTAINTTMKARSMIWREEV